MSKGNVKNSEEQCSSEAPIPINSIFFCCCSISKVSCNSGHVFRRLPFLLGARFVACASLVFVRSKEVSLIGGGAFFGFSSGLASNLRLHELSFLGSFSVSSVFFFLRNPFSYEALRRHDRHRRHFSTLSSFGVSPFSSSQVRQFPRLGKVDGSNR